MTTYIYESDTVEDVRKEILANVDKEINAEEYFLRKKVNVWTLEYHNLDAENMQLFTIEKREEDKFDVTEETLAVTQGNNMVDVFDSIIDNIDSEISIHIDQIDEELGYLYVYYVDSEPELTLTMEIKYLRDKDYSVNTKQVKPKVQAK